MGNQYILRGVETTLKQIIPPLKFLKKPSFWAFFGSGLIVSVAYMDPGNWGTSISGGAQYGYKLLWVVWMASIMAMLFQYLSGKLGIAGYSLAEMIKIKWKDKRLVFGYWLLAEFAILATDMAEFLGIVVALHLLFKVPYFIGTIFAMVDVLLLLVLTRNKFRILEYAFIVFVSVIGFGYVYEIFLAKPDFGAVAAASVTPFLDGQTILIAVGIIGATVMPHALFVHSWLLKEKRKLFNVSQETAMKYHIYENTFSLIIAGFINAAILIMAAAAFFNIGTPVATIEDAYKTLTPLFGQLASIVFAVALLAAGISSSITGVLSGQSIMEALTDFKLSPMMRRLITRIINIIPLMIALLLNIEPLQILVYSQVVLSLLIPVPLIPLLYYTAKKDVMGSLANRPLTTIVAVIFGIVILCFNAFLLYSTFFA
ncbi:MAG TPA: Nramp family divalent metal transporter [Candidatus Nanoarchaeia archaeon]|nr:Nramp family divalent metal transporter [Candidatus Nanoarchaeia archaeon]